MRLKDLKTVFTNRTDSLISSLQQIHLAESNVLVSMVRETLLVKVVQWKAVNYYTFFYKYVGVLSDTNDSDAAVAVTNISLMRGVTSSSGQGF